MSGEVAPHPHTPRWPAQGLHISYLISPDAPRPSYSALCAPCQYRGSPVALLNLQMAPSTINSGQPFLAYVRTIFWNRLGSPPSKKFFLLHFLSTSFSTFTSICTQFTINVSRFHTRLPQIQVELVISAKQGIKSNNKHTKGSRIKQLNSNKIKLNYFSQLQQ